MGKALTTTIPVKPRSRQSSRSIASGANIQVRARLIVAPQKETIALKKKNLTENQIDWRDLFHHTHLLKRCSQKPKVLLE